LARERVKSAALNGQAAALKGFPAKPYLGNQRAGIEELGDMLSPDDGQLSTINGQLFTINGVLANGSHPRPSPTRSSPTRPGISDDKEHDHG
jgi:hypothetical protein